MHVQVSTDNHVEGRDDLIRDVQAAVEDGLSRFGDRLTRVEVYLKDANAHKGGTGDKHCTVEARPAGMQPVAVTHAADSLDEAVDGAVARLGTTLDRTFGRLSDKGDRASMAGDQDY